MATAALSGRPFAFMLKRIFSFSADLVQMIAPWIPLFPLMMLLILAAGWDLASFTIPNFLQVGLILAFIGFALLSQIPFPVLGTHFLAGVIGLVVGFTLFAFGYIGGGDAKLFACIALWLGFRDLPAYTLVACVLGGGLSLALLTLRKLPLPFFLGRYSWVLRLHDPKAGVPYGVALAAGVFLIIQQTEVFRLAATHV